MRLAGVAIVRDECDIVEAFVRHNAAVLDRLYIVDNHSSDATPEILRRLAASGLPVTLGRDEEVRYYQGVKTTALIRTALADEPWDCLLPLDGDEFLVLDDRAAFEAEIAGLAPGEAAVLASDQYAPTESDDPAEPDPVRRIQHRAVAEPALPLFHGKAIVPLALASSPAMAMGEGNHHVLVAYRRMPERWLASARVAHFPVRSAEQFLSKVVTTRLAWLSRRDYRPTLGHHIGLFYDQLRADAAVTPRHLLDAAFAYLDSYLGPHRRTYQRKLVHDPVQRRGGPLLFPDLAGIAALPRILAFAERMAQQLGQSSPELRPEEPGAER